MKYLTALILSLAIVSQVYASEVTGTLTTGVSTGVDGTVIVKPSASPVAGTYTSAQSVTLIGGAGTVSIHYTIDGSAAACTSGNTYTTAISVPSNLVIEAIACYPNSVASDVILFGYAINPPSSGGGGGGGGGGLLANPVTVATDFSGDGKIDVLDFNILITNWGLTPATKASGDANNDGVVDILDFNMLITNWQL